MVSFIRVSLAVALCLLSGPLSAQRPYPPELPDARVEVYRSTADAELRLWIFEPQGHRPGDRRPAVVFFFGGGWNGGSPGQFEQQSRHLAGRGMVAMVADYRVRSRHATLANVAVSDAQAAVRWIRANAEKLGVDPKRIAAGGGSAGGHLAAATATLPDHDKADADRKTSAVPDALLLFNPAVILAPVPELPTPSNERLARLETRLGAEPESMSPYHNIKPGLPPAIVFHGKLDETVPYRHVELFCEAMAAEGNRCELVGYEGEGHGFFNHGRGDGTAYTDTVRRMDAFLVSLGWLRAAPVSAPLVTGKDL